VKEAAKFLERPFDTWLPYDGRAAGKATDKGMPMADAAPRSAAVKPLRAVVAKLQQIHAGNKRREA
jgi:Flp pilus assembly CpaE family ATPase